MQNEEEFTKQLLENLEDLEFLKKNSLSSEHYNQYWITIQYYIELKIDFNDLKL